jgi:hypothetical protein
MQLSLGLDLEEHDIRSDLNMKVMVTIRERSYAYVRHFDSDGPLKVSIVYMSDYLKYGVFDALQILRHNNKTVHDIFILQVIYEDLRDYRKAGDAQLFVTGSVEKYEEKNSKVTALHEIREETRLEPQSEKEINLLLSVETKSEKVDWFSCPVTNLKYKGPKRTRKTRKLPYSYKVSCVVHGTEAEMLDIISSMPKSLIRGNDKIKGLLCMKLVDVENIALRIIRRELLGKRGNIVWYG